MGRGPDDYDTPSPTYNVQRIDQSHVTFPAPGVGSLNKTVCSLTSVSFYVIKRVPVCRLTVDLSLVICPEKRMLVHEKEDICQSRKVLIVNKQIG